MYLGVDQEGSEEIPTGEKSILPGEDEKTMTSLTIIRNCWGEQVILLLESSSKRSNLGRNSCSLCLGQLSPRLPAFESPRRADPSVHGFTTQG